MSCHLAPTGVEIDFSGNILIVSVEYFLLSIIYIFDIIRDKLFDRRIFTSLYYSLQVGGDTQDKTSAYAALDEEDVENYLTDLFTKEPDPNATPDPNYKIECYGCEQ